MSGPQCGRRSIRRRLSASAALVEASRVNVSTPLLATHMAAILQPGLPFYRIFVRIAYRSALPTQIAARQWPPEKELALYAVFRSAKFRRSFLHERGDAFLDLAAVQAVAMAPVGGLFVKLAVGEFIDGTFHAAHRFRRIAGKYGSQPVDFLIERLDGCNRSEVADPQHLGCFDLLRGEEQFFGVVDAEPRHVASDSAFVIMQPEPRRWHEHLASVDANAKIAGERQIGRAPIDPAIEPADRGHSEILEPIGHRFER